MERMDTFKAFEGTMEKNLQRQAFALNISVNI